MSIVSFSIFSGENNFIAKLSGANEKLLTKLSKFICYHQGAFIQYVFLAGEYHKDLKKEFSLKEKNFLEIKRKHDDLLKYVNETLGNVVIRSFDIMHSFFEDRNPELPRICLKVNFDPDRELVTVLFRDQKVKYISEYSICENAGFLYIKNNGRYYLCSDIPNSTKSGDYFNPRLIKEAVQNYNNENWIKKIIRLNKKTSVDENWINCWKGVVEDGKQIKPHYKDCYKSTLIIPLTLWNNNLDKNFLKKFNLREINRTIFAYLCFDHIETNLY